MRNCITFLMAVLLCFSCSKNSEVKNIQEQPVSSIQAVSLSNIQSLQTSLNVLFNVKVGGSDFMATKNAIEASNFTID
ncbi:hypothetical protein [Gaetbulibacter aestuarii]|uniref:Uncharacterized protein n=1 Tax=Gaetbulibacter aestuarii TaxID=1502358 RepID=A0ABW7N127_9FLAO